MGWVVVTDAGFLSAVWALFAVITGLGLAVAAIAFVRHVRDTDVDFTTGYNALAPVLKH